MSKSGDGRRLRRYVVAFVAVALSVWASWLLAPFTEGRTAFLPLLPAVMLIAWYGGLGPGLFATILGATAGNYFLQEPKYYFKVVHFYDWMRLVLFALCGIIASILSQLLLQARQRAETARQQAEEHLRLLKSSEELLRLMVAGVKEHAIFMLDPQGRVATWNAGAQRIKGYSSEEIIGQPYARFFAPEDVAGGKPQRLLQTAVQQGQVEDEGWRMRKDGTRFWADAILTAIRDEQGVLRGFAKITRDMTERRKAEEIAQEARQARQFIATLSHELRTPLTPILGVTATLEADAQLPPAVKEDLRMIRRNVELEARLVDDLLDWSKAASGKLNLHFEAVDAHAAVSETLDLCRQEIDRKRLA